MLLLTRRVGETIRIGTEISLTVIAIKGGQVRLGIKAPESVQVHREEIYQRIVRERGAGEGDAAGVNVTVRKSTRKTTPPG